MKPKPAKPASKPTSKPTPTLSVAAPGPSRRHGPRKDTPASRARKARRLARRAEERAKR